MAHVLPPAPPMRSAANTRQEPVTVGALRVVAEGVPTAVHPDQQTGDGRYPIAWLTITAPRGATPTATSICQCGRNLFAAGHHKALALIADHTDHKTRCPLRADQEGAAA
ncbi:MULTISPECIES: hypothetical protein [Streptomyces]|uniref:hypothetical protein n=1 Tax=Streptomyces TaxID=1883 RepID=UPI00214CAB73|nr:hypothetical protein [Streptomyces sp. 09ZI22]